MALASVKKLMTPVSMVESLVLQVVYCWSHCGSPINQETPMAPVSMVESLALQVVYCWSPCASHINQETPMTPCPWWSLFLCMWCIA